MHPRRATGIPAGLAALALLSALAWMPGCAGAEPVSIGEIAGSGALPSEVARGRVRDLDPAVAYVGQQLDMAVVTQREGEGGERVYRLVSAIDEPVWVFVTSEAGWDEKRKATRLGIRAKVGHFGDDQRERALARRIADRLEALRERARE